MAGERIPLGVVPDAPVRVFDVGAMLEGAPRYGVLSGPVEIHAFEPNASERAKLQAAGLPWIIHPHCLGDGGRHTLHITRYPGCSSLLEPDPAILNLFCNIGTDGPEGNFAVVASEAVTTRRLDDFGLPPPDLMKLDIQGAELMVLENGRAALASCVAVEIETEFLPLYRGQPLFHDLAAFMHAQGFVLHKMLDVAGRCFRPVAGRTPDRPLSQVLWADSVFIRDPGRVAGMTRAALVTAATVMAEVYRSYDLAVFYLGEIDRRDGGTLAMDYLRALAGAGDLDRLYFNHRDEGDWA
jgi:hypothetical protein